MRTQPYLLLSFFVFLFHVAGQAQDYIGHTHNHVVGQLSAEQTSYIQRQTTSGSVIISVEEGDTAMWCFGSDSLCNEYRYSTHISELPDLQRYLRFNAREVNEFVFINVREGTICYLSSLGDRLLLVTRRYDPDEHFSKPPHSEFIKVNR